MRAKESIRDISTSSLRLTQHQQLLAEIEAREEKYDHVVQLGQALLQDEEMPSKEVTQTPLSSVMHIQHWTQCNCDSILYHTVRYKNMYTYLSLCMTYICLSLLPTLGTKTSAPFLTSAADVCRQLLKVPCSKAGLLQEVHQVLSHGVNSTTFPNWIFMQRLHFVPQWYTHTRTVCTKSCQPKNENTQIYERI